MLAERRLRPVLVDKLIPRVSPYLREEKAERLVPVLPGRSHLRVPDGKVYVLHGGGLHCLLESERISLLQRLLVKEIRRHDRLEIRGVTDLLGCLCVDDELLLKRQVDREVIRRLALNNPMDVDRDAAREKPGRPRRDPREHPLFDVGEAHEGKRGDLFLIDAVDEGLFFGAGHPERRNEINRLHIGTQPRQDLLRARVNRYNNSRKAKFLPHARKGTAETFYSLDELRVREDVQTAERDHLPECLEVVVDPLRRYHKGKIGLGGAPLLIVRQVGDVGVEDETAHDRLGEREAFARGSFSDKNPYGEH